MMSFLSGQLLSTNVQGVIYELPIIVKRIVIFVFDHKADEMIIEHIPVLWTDQQFTSELHNSKMFMINKCLHL